MLSSMHLKAHVPPQNSYYSKSFPLKWLLSGLLAVHTQYSSLTLICFLMHCGYCGDGNMWKCVVRHRTLNWLWQCFCVFLVFVLKVLGFIQGNDFGRNCSEKHIVGMERPSVSYLALWNKLSCLLCFSLHGTKIVLFGNGVTCETLCKVLEQYLIDNTLFLLIFRDQVKIRIMHDWYANTIKENWENVIFVISCQFWISPKYLLV